MKKYVLVGAGNRGYWMYAKAIRDDYADCAVLAGIMDINRMRAEYVKRQMGQEIPVYTDFAKMLQEVVPDCAIITTTDRYHNDYVVQALDMGVEVICEKPLTIDEVKLNQILDARERNGKNVTVTFNCRYMPHFEKIKDLLIKGAVGQVYSVHFEWMLDCVHGADYFRRWHRRMENSGGLLVHKSTHHFDIVNWLIDQDPEEVSAFGALRFYGDEKKQKGLRCSACTEQTTCPFVYAGLSDPSVQEMYFDCEKEDGYFRDRCVFDPEINIYDTVSLNVRYSKGASMTYSLIAYGPYEGWKLSITGSEGRLEAAQFDTGPQAEDQCFHIKMFDREDGIMTYDMKKGTGSHGGADTKLLDRLFRQEKTHGEKADPLGQSAGLRAGALSILIGIGANKSIQEGKIVKIADLVELDRLKGL